MAGKQQSEIRIDVESIRLWLATSFEKLRSRVSIDTIRPLPIFLGLNPGDDLFPSSKAFSSPVKAMDLSCPIRIQRRIKANCSYFLSNYVLLTVMTTIVVAMMHPGMLISVAIVYALWALHGFLLRHEVVLGGISVQNLMSVQQRFYALFVITAITIIVACLVPAMIVTGISIILILAHAAMRDTAYLEVTDEPDGSPLTKSDSFPNQDNDNDSGETGLLLQKKELFQK